MSRLRFLLGRRQSADTPARATHAFDRAEDARGYHGGPVLGASTLGELALSPALHDEVWAILDRLEPDDNVSHVRDFVAEGRRLAGREWRYVDIASALAAATELLRPSSYLEVGVRRGRSMAIVAARAPKCSIIGVDMWQPNYAGMENPGRTTSGRSWRRSGSQATSSSSRVTAIECYPASSRSGPTYLRPHHGRRRSPAARSGSRSARRPAPTPHRRGAGLRGHQPPAPSEAARDLASCRRGGAALLHLALRRCRLRRSGRRSSLVAMVTVWVSTARALAARLPDPDADEVERLITPVREELRRLADELERPVN